MKTFKVEIMPCGTKAKTVNPLGEKQPVLSDYFMLRHFYKGTEEQYENDIKQKTKLWTDALKQWQQAESERKLYEIEIINRQNCKCMIMSHAYKVKNCVFPHCLHKGSIHEATEINTKQIRIL